MRIFKYINTSLWICGVLLIASCSDQVIDDVLENVTSGAILRNLGETNNLDVSDPSTTYSIQLEAQDASGGSLLQEVRVNVGFNDGDDTGTGDVAMTAFTVIPASAFTDTSPTTNGLPVGTFSTTLEDLMTHVGTTLTSISTADNFIIDFEMVLTDGRVFNRGNATGDITRTGRFSFFNSQFRYNPVLGDRNRLVVNDLSIKDNNGLGTLNSGSSDTVFVTFDRTPTFVTAPTITRTSTAGATDDVIGALTQLEDEDYFFIYTAGATATDTISFTVTGGSVVAGFIMSDADLDDAYVIDNVTPTGIIGDIIVRINELGSVSDVSVTINFSETLKESESASFNISSTDFNGMGSITSLVLDDLGSSITINFFPTQGGTNIDDNPFSFDLTFVGISDLVGNSVSNTFTVDVF